MLNKNNERELAYLTRVEDITPMDADRLECAHIGGWRCVVGKNEFKVGDLAVYFEIDSQLPDVEPFSSMEFLRSKHFKIKSQKIRGEISQGLLVPICAFGWSIVDDNTVLIPDTGEKHCIEDETKFLTNYLKVTYAVAADNIRKARSDDKYKRMAQAHPTIARTKIWKWLWRFAWGKKILFIFFGKKKYKKNSWPEWVAKTDEERIQNCPWVLQDKSPWVATEKIDGTSTTFTIKRGKRFHKNQFYVCSRNVVFDNPEKTCFYDTNVYLEMAEKYHIKEKMEKMLDSDMFADCKWITIQGETYGPGIQKRDYHAPGHMFMAFNFITSKDGRWGTEEMDAFLNSQQIPCVPILARHFILPDTVEELLDFTMAESMCDHDLREGVVFRSKDGSKSFKAVSNEYLIAYHQ